MLIDNGADIDCEGIDDETPLILAAGYGDFFCTIFLMKCKGMRVLRVLT